MRRLCRRLPGRIGFPFSRQTSSNSFTFQYLGHILAFGILAWLSLIIMTKFNYVFGSRMVLALGLFCIVLPAGVLAGEDETETAKTKGLEPILTYISKSWDTLTRSMADCSTVVAPKLAEHSVLYLPADVTGSAQTEDRKG